jgi:catalase
MSQRVPTTESGAPVADNQNSATAGVGGPLPLPLPLPLQDQHLLEKLARFNRERIPVGVPPTPSRQWGSVVHARGSGAYGHFEVTDDVTGFTHADFLSETGKRTEVFLRFSTVADSLGGAHAVRDPRGFAVKFYTAEGDYDLVGNNTPVFFIKDPVKFPDFIHSQKRDPLLDRNPDNVFAEVEQAAFSPNNFVPGIGPSPDKMLQGRLFAYADAHRYRLGVDHTRLAVNAPRATTAQNYGRDGLMAVNPQGRYAKNYEPNSYDGPVETGRPLSAPLAVTGHTGTRAAPSTPRTTTSSRPASCTG